MKNKINPFSEPIYITRPILPEKLKLFKFLGTVLESQQLTNNGPKVREFTNKLEKFLDVSHISLFCNGTLALLLACQALRLTGEVITTPFTFAATSHVLYWNNIEPVFCDIDENTGNIDPNQIEKWVTPRTTGILPVHVFGMPCDVDGISEIANRYGLKVIYDAAHAFGVKLNGKSICNFGDITALSFHATKIFHSIEGGALVYLDTGIKRRVELARNFGFEGEESVVVPGINAKMNEIEAVMGILNLDLFDRERLKRKNLSEIYKYYLNEIEGISFFESKMDYYNNYYNMVIKIDEKKFGKSRDFVYENLKRYNVFTRKYFYPLCSNFQCYRGYKSSDKSNLIIANKLSEQVLTLPLYGDLKINDVKKICKIIISLKFA